MEVTIEKSWKAALENEFEKDYFRDLANFVRSEYLSKTIYPSPKNIFAAFDFCPLDDVRVVILGQDPYHGPGQANGLCFSVSDGVRMPPSLKNIFKEIGDDLGKTMPETGNLERWARQGVFLLNATLTVQARTAGSHQNKGWEIFTDSVIRALSESKENLVFLLWGAYAGRKAELIDSSKHLILRSPHPSPFSAHRGFLGNKHFSQTNAYLSERGLDSIDW